LRQGGKIHGLFHGLQPQAPRRSEAAGGLCDLRAAMKPSIPWILILLAGVLGAFRPDDDTVLFDFEDAADLRNWSLPTVAVDFSRSTAHATSGRHSLKLTFSGDALPTVATAQFPVDDWSGFQTFQADAFADRPCVVLFRILQEKSTRGKGWGDLIGRWEKA